MRKQLKELREPAGPWGPQDQTGLGQPFLCASAGTVRHTLQLWDSGVISSVSQETEKRLAQLGLSVCP